MRLVLALLLAAGTAVAHDLEENRATVVLRDKTHVSLTLFLNYTAALHQALLPQREFGAFLLTYSAMKPGDLEKELVRAQRQFEASLQIRGKDAGANLRFTGWTWPDAKTIQGLLQRQVMQAMVDGHVHEQPVEVRAEAVSAGEVTGLTVRFPKEFQKVLVVSYRPNQVWVDSRTGGAAEVRF